MTGLDLTPPPPFRELHRHGGGGESDPREQPDPGYHGWGRRRLLVLVAAPRDAGTYPSVSLPLSQVLIIWWDRLLQVRLHEIENGTGMTIARASKLLANRLAK